MNAELSFLGRRHLCSDMFRPHLESKTNAERGNAEVEYLLIKRRRLRLHGRGASRKNDPRRSRFFDVVGFDGRGIGDDAEDAELRELLDDEVVELRAHREEQYELRGFPHAHLLGDLFERF